MNDYMLRAFANEIEKIASMGHLIPGAGLAGAALGAPIGAGVGALTAGEGNRLRGAGLGALGGGLGGGGLGALGAEAGALGGPALMLLMAKNPEIFRGIVRGAPMFGSSMAGAGLGFAAGGGIGGGAGGYLAGKHARPPEPASHSSEKKPKEDEEHSESEKQASEANFIEKLAQLEVAFQSGQISAKEKEAGAEALLKGLAGGAQGLVRGVGGVGRRIAASTGSGAAMRSMAGQAAVKPIGVGQALSQVGGQARLGFNRAWGAAKAGAPASRAASGVNKVLGGAALAAPVAGYAGYSMGKDSVQPAGY